MAGAGVSLLASSLALASFGSWAEPVSAQTLPTVTIGKAVDTIPFTVVDVALAEGYFTQNGVDVKEELVQGSSAANAAMVGGSLQFACEAADPLMLARSHGVPIMAVDALDDGVTLQLVVSNQWLAKHPIRGRCHLRAEDGRPERLDLRRSRHDRTSVLRALARLGRASQANRLPGRTDRARRRPSPLPFRGA